MPADEINTLPSEPHSAEPTLRFGLRSLFALTTVLAILIVAIPIYWRSAGIVGWMFEDTVWAPGYSEQAFDAIKVGMTTQQVRKLMGPPIETGPWNGNRRYEGWTRSPSDSDYRMRGVAYEGNVVDVKISMFYWD